MQVVTIALNISCLFLLKACKISFKTCKERLKSSF